MDNLSKALVSLKTDIITRDSDAKSICCVFSDIKYLLKALDYFDILIGDIDIENFGEDRYRVTIDSCIVIFKVISEVSDAKSGKYNYTYVFNPDKLNQDILYHLGVRATEKFTLFQYLNYYEWEKV